MEVKETNKKTLQNSRMLEDNEYYRFIFKKTEKIACAVVYVLRSGNENGHKDALLVDLESLSQKLIEQAVLSLSSSTGSVEMYAQTLQYNLIMLEAKLRLAHAARLIGREVLEVFIHEIDSTLRSLKRYTERTVVQSIDDFEENVGYGGTQRSEKTGVVRTQRQSNVGIGGNTATQSLVSRRERVLQIIREKGQVTIKDVTDVIKDCSEKTIQRELISLVKDNIVKKEGERRWSKYTIA